MKTTSLAVLALICSTSAFNIKTFHAPSQALSQTAKGESMKMQLNQMTDDQVFNLVQESLKADPKKEQASSKNEAVSKDADMKAVEAVLADRILGRLISGGYIYGSTLAYPIDKDIALKIAALRAYHELVLNYELSNAIAGLVEPSVADVLRVLQAATGDDEKKEEKKGGEPAKKSLLQIEETGVPVLIQPKLMSNEVADVDLGMRNVIIDGVDGFDYVQTAENGVPVYVQPKLLTNQVSDADLNQRGYIIDGVDGFNFVQTTFPEPISNEDATESISIGGDNVKFLQTSDIDDTTVLMVDGVPVYVQPKLMKDPFGASPIREKLIIGEDDIKLIQTDEVDDTTVLQIDGVPVYVNPKPMKDPMENADLGSKIIVGSDDVKYVQLENPVVNPPFNNWSVNQPSRPHDQGMQGTEDLGQNIIVDGTRVHYAQNKK